MTRKPADPAAEEAQRALERTAIERLDAGAEAASPEEAAARAPYEALVGRLRETDEECEPPAGWEDRAVARWRGGRRQRWLRVAAGAAAGMGLAAVLMLRCTVGTEGGLTVAVVNESGQVRRGEGVPTVGDTLRARTPVGETTRVLLYLGTKRIASCPGSAACREEDGALVLEWPLVEAGDYRILVISTETGAAPLELPSGMYEVDLAAAREAGARIEDQVLQVSL